ncbi:MAG: pyrimidine dimer DNA glycosylase [Deltaproteobacteria bacterium]|nr:pyrimidine dimer DNA glycosylase [Deltaproteobacteria bacterium]
MRVWDIDQRLLCDRHLLGEHNEIHTIWSVITNNLKGYSNHPETKRWRGSLKALYLRHEATAKEMERRGFNHKSPLDKRRAIGKAIQDELIDPIEVQKMLLSEKDKECAERIRKGKGA